MLKNKIVIIDPGHGGSDSGAVANGIVEKVANLTTALALRAYLESKGIKVFMTRTTDVFLSLEARTNMANNIMAQYPNCEVIFVSIHHNAGGGDRGEYIHSIHRGKGQALANIIAAEMQSQLGQQPKVYEKMGSGNADYYHVIRATNMDAIIVEVCFLDNALDVQIADTLPEQQRNGRVIGAAIGKHFGMTLTEDMNKPVVVPPTTSEEPYNVYYQVYTAAHGWLPEVRNLEDYAGLFGYPILAVRCRIENTANIVYRTSNVNADYYPYVTNDTDYAGDKKNAIDRLQIKSKMYRYRVHVMNVGWLSFMKGLIDEGGSNEDFAGIRGAAIDGIQIEPVKLKVNVPNPPTTNM